jgi:hypothetical protein
VHLEDLEGQHKVQFVESISWLPLVSLIIYIFFFSIGKEWNYYFIIAER